MWTEENVPEERNSNNKGDSMEHSKNWKSCIMEHGVRQVNGKRWAGHCRPSEGF